jgi:hypothetical protein
MPARFFSPLLLGLPRLTNPDLVRTVLFLKAENAMLRKRLPWNIRPEPSEREKLLRLGQPLGRILDELISIVTFRTFQRWIADRDGTRRVERGNTHPRHRPSQALNGPTPDEVWYDRPPANEKPRMETRRNWPRDSRCASPWAPIRGRRGTRVSIKVSYPRGGKHLPLIRLKRVTRRSA